MVRSISRSRSSSGVHLKSAIARPAPKIKDLEPAAPKNASERLSRVLFGVKGSSLSRNEFEENPMARLKLLLVSRSYSRKRMSNTRTPLDLDCIFPYITHPELLYDSHTSYRSRKAPQT